MRQALVTAGAGQIGRAVVRRLTREGVRVVVLDARPLPDGVHAAKQVFARVSDASAVADALEGCTDIVHLEWSGGVREATETPLEKHEAAVTGSLRLLDAARREGLRFLFASTCLYRGDSTEPLHEDAPISTRSVYAVQKRYVEAMVQAYAESFDFESASLRIFNAYGPGGRPGQILNGIRRAIADGTPLVLNGDGGQVRDFVHVDDIAIAVLDTLFAKELAGQPINVGTGVGTSMRELVRLAESVTGRTIPVVHAPAKAEESRFLVADPQRAAERLGWWPSISLEDGLRTELR